MFDARSSWGDNVTPTRGHRTHASSVGLMQAPSSSAEEHRPSKSPVAGSNPVWGTTRRAVTMARLEPMATVSENDRLVWIDCEMTGLDVAVDELVEIAVVITDFNLKILDPGFQLVIKPSNAALANMGEFVSSMHTASGLDQEIPNGVSLAEAQARTLEYIKRFVPVERKAPLAGNSIGTDRMFLAKYMPEVDQWLHYRNVDVSSIKELSRRWYPRVFFNAPPKDGGHRALADILESIRELEYYRRAVFVEQPGPTSDQAREVAANAVSAFAAKA